MDEPFLIWIDRLKGGQTQKINETFHPSFLEIEEKELLFESPVGVKGEAYITEEELIVHLKAATKGVMPCSICNKMTQFELKIDNFYHAEPLENIPSAIFNFKEALREALLIELPQYLECRGGNCPERTAIEPYLRAEKREEKTTYFPFSGLDT